MFDLSNPVIARTQELANRNGKTYVMIPNIIGGIDAVPAERVGLDSDMKIVGYIYPTKLLGAA